jgi:peptidoglycan/xylan/chitin deacetylase (PgdA/CDA1 family)
MYGEGNPLMRPEMDNPINPSWDSIIRKINVLLYHRIRQKHGTVDTTDIAVFDETFRKQMAFLDRWGYVTITFDDYRLCREGKLSLPKKPIILTFDDAYEEIYTVALPILKEFGMKAVIFTMADPSIDTSIWDEQNGGDYKLLNVQQILELHNAGFEIGSHSLTHPDLTAVSKEKAWEEITRSRMLLEILLNSPVRSFSYPYGLMNEEVKKMTMDAGYTVGCGAYSGPPVFGMDMFEIRRTKVRNTSKAILFRFQLNPLYSMYRWFLWKLKTAIRSHRNAPHTGVDGEWPRIKVDREEKQAAHL